jgi:hypothetical protein
MAVITITTRALQAGRVPHLKSQKLNNSPPPDQVGASLAGAVKRRSAALAAPRSRAVPAWPAPAKRTAHFVSAASDQCASEAGAKFAKVGLGQKKGGMQKKGGE